MTTATSFTKEIAYDRETRDFRATLDGNYIGHFDSYYEAEVALDEAVVDPVEAVEAAEVEFEADAVAALEVVVPAEAVPVLPGVAVPVATVWANA